MIALVTLCGLLLFPLKAECHISKVFVQEAKTVTLTCAFPEDGDAGMQWLAPNGFVLFYNNVKVLKDQRFQLIQYSQTVLTIRLSGVTLEDEGIYTCLKYSHPVQTRRVRVTVVAVPAKPVLVINHGEDDIILNCFTFGSKPPPDITWLIDDSTEVFGQTKYEFESDGKKCNATSTLRVKSFTFRSTARCNVRLSTLHHEHLSASFMFQTLLTDEAATRIPSQTSPLRTATEAEIAPNSAVTKPTTPGHNVTEAEIISSGPVTSQTSHHPTESTRTSQISERNQSLSVDVEPTSGQAEPTFNQNASSASATSSQSSEQNSSLSSNVEETKSSTGSIYIQSTMEDVKFLSGNSSGTMFLVLVSLMICVLLIIVQLFLVKLKRAHAKWKKENEISEQTLESTKSRSNNEDGGSQPKNGQDINQNTEIQYNKDVAAV